MTQTSATVLSKVLILLLGPVFCLSPPPTVVGRSILKQNFCKRQILTLSTHKPQVYSRLQWTAQTLNAQQCKLMLTWPELVLK